MFYFIYLSIYLYIKDDRPEFLGIPSICMLPNFGSKIRIIFKNILFVLHSHIFKFHHKKESGVIERFSCYKSMKNFGRHNTEVFFFLHPMIFFK